MALPVILLLVLLIPASASAEIQFAGYLNPPEVSVQSGDKVAYFAQVYVQGVTEEPGENRSITAQLVFQNVQGKRVAVYPMVYNVDIRERNDEYFAIVKPGLDSGSYSVTAEFRLENDTHFTSTGLMSNGTSRLKMIDPWLSQVSASTLGKANNAKQKEKASDDTTHEDRTKFPGENSQSAPGNSDDDDGDEEEDEEGEENERETTHKEFPTIEFVGRLNPDSMTLDQGQKAVYFVQVRAKNVTDKPGHGKRLVGHLVVEDQLGKEVKKMLLRYNGDIRKNDEYYAQLSSELSPGEYTLSALFSLNDGYVNLSSKGQPQGTAKLWIRGSKLGTESNAPNTQSSTSDSTSVAPSDTAAYVDPAPPQFFLTMTPDFVPPVTSLSIDFVDTLTNSVVPPSLFLLAATDTGSVLNGISEIFYRVDTASFEKFGEGFTPQDLNLNMGPHTLEYYSVDSAGNVEETKSDTFDLVAFGSSEIDTSTGTRVLVWMTNAKSVSSTAKEILSLGVAAAQNVETTAISENRAAFTTALRSGFYNLFIIIGDSNVLDSPEEELIRENVRAGAGLVAALNRTVRYSYAIDSADHQTNNLFRVGLEVKFGADLNLKISDPEFAELTELALFGTLYSSDSFLSIPKASVTNGTQTVPVIFTDTFGVGRVIYLGFDLIETIERGNDEENRKIIRDLVDYASGDQKSVLAGGLVGIKVGRRANVADLITELQVYLPNKLTLIDAGGGSVQQERSIIRFLETTGIGDTTSNTILVKVPLDERFHEADVELRYLLRGQYHLYLDSGLEISNNMTRSELLDSALVLLSEFEKTVAVIHQPAIQAHISNLENVRRLELTDDAVLGSAVSVFLEAIRDVESSLQNQAEAADLLRLLAQCTIVYSAIR